MRDDIAFLSLNDLIQRFREKTASPVEAMEAVYDRMERHEPALNAFVHRLDREAALAAAAASETRWANDNPLGPLDGVAITVKDALLAKGWASRKGSQLTDPDTPDAEDSPAVARIREQGAVLIGKTTMPEFGWKGVTDCPLTGVSRNPWNLDMTCGGSSGGSAAALAAGIGHAAIGTDAGGSVRIPGSFCGLVAIKATYGRVPNYPPTAAGSLGNIGPMMRTVADTALMLNVMAGFDARDGAALPQDGRDYTDGLDDGIHGMRVAYSPTLGYGKVDADVAALVAAAAEAFEDLGASVELVEAPFGDPTDCFRNHFFAGIAHALHGAGPEQLKLLDPGLVNVLEQARKVDIETYMSAIDQRVALSRASKLFFESYDLLLTPTMSVPAFEAGRLSPDGYDQENWMEWSPFTYPFNLTGQPALSVPCGFTEGGLPVGLQIAGQYFDEPTVLRAARAYEREHLFADRRCPLE